MKCAIHLEKEASSSCNHCGRSICPECQVLKRNESYCQDCAAGKTPIKEKRSPALAGFMSFIIAGLGQIYNGQIGKGVLIFLTSILVVPWLLGIFDAYNTAKKINAGQVPFAPRKGCLIAFAISTCLVMVVLFFTIFIGLIALSAFFTMTEEAQEFASESEVEVIPNTLEIYESQGETLRQM
jgi:TM2 domain-containing membrane protein YozV